MAQQPQQQPYVNVPDTVSPEAQAYLRTLGNPAMIPAFPEPDDIEGWKKRQAVAESNGKALSKPLLARYEHTVTEARLGGVPVLDIRPGNWKDNGKALVYTHGGAHSMFSAASSLGRPVVAAHETGLRIISVDYTVAPHAKYDRMSDQVVAALQALVKDGQRLQDTVIFGDSSGGGLAAAVVLKMRDRGLGMPKATVLVCPWVDITPSGDTDTTLHAADPTGLYEMHFGRAAAAFADPKDRKHPYASPVYGDFSKGFPPTLIQGGTKEVLLSGYVRLYQALDAAGIPVKLDLYEAMIHNFPDRIPDAPEAILARRKMRTFVHQQLGIGG
jgi:acetyl esterase/lipase